MCNKKSEVGNKGFTLIEILVVIGLIAVLAAIVLIAINPGRQFAQARNTQRTSDVSAISNAIGQYIADHKGVATTTFTGTTDAEDFCSDLVPTYIAALPVDPSQPDPVSISDCADSHETGYEISTTTSNRIMVKALDAELSQTIEIIR